MPDIRTSEKQITKRTKRKREGEKHTLPQLQKESKKQIIPEEANTWVKTLNLRVTAGETDDQTGPNWNHQRRPNVARPGSKNMPTQDNIHVKSGSKNRTNKAQTTRQIRPLIRAACHRYAARKREKKHERAYPFPQTLLRRKGNSSKI